MSACLIVAVVGHLHVVDRIGHQIAQCLVVGFCRELESLVGHAEPVVVACYEVDASLALYFLVE